MQAWIQSLFEKLKQKETLLFAVIFAFFVSFRVWLITGVPKMLLYAPHDDLFFAKAAHYLIDGQWMGPYSQMALIKGPLYPIFMAMSFFTGLPLYLNETIFYVAACIILFYAFAPLIENPWWRLLLFSLLLFAPAGLAERTTIAVRRDFVYFSLTLYIVACSIGLILRLEKNLATLFTWSFGLGIFMGAFMITREEGVWIYPVLLLLLTGCLLFVWLKNTDQKLIRSFLVVLPILLWYIPVLIVSYLNYSHYGFWGTAETVDPDFNRVINTLDSIETNDRWHPALQIPQKAREKAYEASPILREMRDVIESSVPYWKVHHDKAMSSKPEWYLSQYGNAENEISSGHFLWMFRDVVYDQGYYASGKYPRDFYEQLADQLQTACSDGKLVCSSPKKIPLIGSIDRRHYPIILRMLYEETLHLLNLDYVKIISLDIKTWPVWPKNYDEYKYFEEFAYNSINGPGIPLGNDAQYVVNGKADLRLKILQHKEKIMRSIFNVYRMFTLPAFTAALVIWIIFVGMSALSRKWTSSQNTYLCISSLILGLFFSRIMTLVIIDATTSISAVHFYSSSNLIFTNVFSFLMLYWIAVKLPARLVTQSTMVRSHSFQ